MPPLDADQIKAGLAVAGFLLGTFVSRMIEQLVYRRHPAVVEGEITVEAAATVVEAERIVRRSR